MTLSSKILRHYFNNIISSFQILPTSINPQDQHFWDGYYDPNVYSGANIIFLVFGIVTITAGISAAVHHQKYIGLIPLVIFFGYHLSNALALTSGNRYAQPVSWVVLFYYALGLQTYIRFFLFKNNPDRKVYKDTLFNQMLSNSNRKRPFPMSIILFLILAIGSTPAAADLLPKKRFPWPV